MSENGSENNSRMLTASGAIPLNNEYMAESRKNIYNNVMRNIESMAKEVKEYKQKIGKDKPKSVVLEDNSCNVISFLGGRGSGKTSMLLTVLKQIEKNEIEYIQENNTEKKEKTKLKSYVVPIIDPDKFNFEKDALGWVIFSFAETIESIENQVKDYKYCKEDGKKELVESYNKLKKSYLKSRENYLINTASIMGGTAEYNKMTEELITSDINMTKYFIEFIDRFIKTLDIDLIFFSFDDVDLCPEQGPSIIRTIIDYMSSHPAIVTFILGELKLFEETIAIDMVNRSKVPFDMITKDEDKKLGFNFESKKETASKILTKAMPIHLRNKLEPLTTQEKLDFVHTSYHSSDKNKDKTLGKLMEEIELSEEYRLIDLFKYPIEKMEKMRDSMTRRDLKISDRYTLLELLNFTKEEVEKEIKEGKKTEQKINEEEIKTYKYFQSFNNKDTSYISILPSLPRELNMFYSELSILQNNKTIEKKDLFSKIFEILQKENLKNNIFEDNDINEAIEECFILNREKIKLDYNYEKEEHKNSKRLLIIFKYKNKEIKLSEKESFKIKFINDLDYFINKSSSYLIEKENMNYMLGNEYKITILNPKIFLYDDYFYDCLLMYYEKLIENSEENKLSEFYKEIPEEYEYFKPIKEKIKYLNSKYNSKIDNMKIIEMFSEKKFGKYKIDEMEEFYDKFIIKEEQHIFCKFIESRYNNDFKVKNSPLRVKNINPKIISLLISCKLVREDKYVRMGINYIYLEENKLKKIKVEQIDNQEEKESFIKFKLNIESAKKELDEFFKREYKESAYFYRVKAYYLENIKRNIEGEDVERNKILRCYEEAYKLDKNNIYEYIQYLYRENRHEMLDLVLNDIIKSDKENVAIISEYAIFKTEIKKEYSEAERLFRVALELNGDNVVLLGNYARYNELIKRDVNEITRLYDIAYSSTNKEISLMLNFARRKKAQGDLKGAIEIYKEIYFVEPYNRVAALEYAILIGGDFIENELKNNRKETINNMIEYYTQAIEIFEKYIEDKSFYYIEMSTYFDYILYKNIVKMENKIEYTEFLKYINIKKEKIKEEILRNYEILYEEKININLIIKHIEFLLEVEKKYDIKRLEKIFRKGFSIDNNNIKLLIQYGNFLDNIQNKRKESEKQYLKVLTIEPNNEEAIELYEELKAKIEAEEVKVQKTTDTRIMTEVKKFNKNLDESIKGLLQKIEERISKLEKENNTTKKSETSETEEIKIETEELEKQE